MKDSKIEWCDHTFNPFIGCTKVSPGCANCYAEAMMAMRLGVVNWGPGAPRKRTSVENWKQPLKWNREAKCTNDHDGDGNCHMHRKGCPRPRVFCASLADWLDDEVPIEWLADLLKLIEQTPNLDWLMLTKRPQNWRTRIEEAQRFAGCAVDAYAWAVRRHNVWWGTSVEDQTRADERIPELLKIPARVRFLSCEPLLGPVSLMHYTHGVGQRSDGTTYRIEGIDWVICGGESGPKARPMNRRWARSLRDQCKAAGVLFFMKQMGGVRDKRGEIKDLDEDLRVREVPND